MRDFKNRFPFFPGVDAPYSTPMAVTLNGQPGRIAMRHEYPLSHYPADALPWPVRDAVLQNTVDFTRSDDVGHGVTVNERRLFLTGRGILPATPPAGLHWARAKFQKKVPLEHVLWRSLDGAPVLVSDVHPTALDAALVFLEQEGWRYQVVETDFSFWCPGVTIPVLAAKNESVLEEVLVRSGVWLF